VLIRYTQVNIAGEVVYELGKDRRTAVEKLAGHLSHLLQATTVDATAQAGVSPLTLAIISKMRTVL
jgi:hypothetical protein